MKKELLKLFFKQFGRKPKDQLEWLQWRFKNSQQSGKGQILRPDFGKKNPWYKGEGEVIDTSFRPDKKVNMSNEDYSSLKDEWFTKIIANTDDALNTFLKRGIDKADKRFSNLTQNQRKDFLNMVEYRLKHGNKKFMNDFTDAKGEFKLPEDLAGGGIAGMLGEPTYQDDSHRVPYGGGGAGKPPVTFTLQGGGSYGSNKIGPGLDLTQSGYGFDLGTEIGLPWGFSATGGVGIGRGKTEVDYNDQNVFSGVDETKLGDKWNVGLKWSKKFNEGGRVPYKNAKLVDPGYFMYQEPAEDRPSRYEYNPGDSRVKREMERLKKELIEAGIIERKIFSEADRMPASNPYFLEFMEEENLGTGAGEATPEEYEEQEKVLRLKQEVKDGGRIGFGLGGFEKARRLFLKTMGAGAVGVGAAKSGLFGLLKGSKSAAVKDLTQIPIHNAEGMPAWFKPLVNRVIKEGTDITKLPPNKGGALAERQIVHSAKLGENKGVKVIQDLDNQSIRVEYQSADNMGGVDDAVYLEYKAAEEVEPMLARHMDPTNPKGEWLPNKAQKTKPTFEANEAYPYQDPKDYKSITFEGDNTVGKVDDLLSDTSALKQFGTNKALSKKELAIAKQKQKRVKEIHDNPSEELAGSGPDYDDFAEGGRVPLALGRGTEQAIAENKALEEGIALNKKRTERFNKRMIDIAIKQAPEGVLMDPPPEPNWSLIEELKNPKDRGLPPINTPMSDIVVFDDGTVYYKDTGEYYKEDGTKVTGPSKGAKPVPKTMEAAEGGRVPLKGGGRGALLEGLGKLFDEFFPGTTKLGQRSKPYPEKVQEKMDVRKALADFQERQKNKKLIDEDIKIRAKELDLDEGYLRSTHKTHIEDKAGVGSLEDFTADFNKELGLNVSKEVLRHPWRVKRSYPFSTPIVDKTGKYIGDEATQQMYPKSKKFIVKDSDELTKEIDFMRGENKITSHAGDLEKAGEGRFTKVEVLKQMFENTVKQSKSAKDKKMFTNFMKEIESKPELANDPKVWNFFTGNLPKNQKLVVYGDDTVDFWRQSEFGPHNIKTTEKFMKKHPHLTKDQAVKIQNMEPEDQIFEMKKIEALRKKNMHASGGLAGMLGE